MNETQQPTTTELVADEPHAHGDIHADHRPGDAHDVSAHVNKYLMVGALLLIFTGLTVFLSYVDFGSHKMNMAVGMLVATIKATLVAAIFMHLSSERQLVYRILIFTGFFVMALFWLTYLHWYDPISR
ncbi:MAG: cytochrome C oxidase subunit IV family protein [Chthoniobacterales bacterium]